MMTVDIPFTKAVGTGNDFLIVDARHHRLGALNKRWSHVARALCDRRDGVGADGILVLEPSATAACVMRVFNPDGSEAEMCGNGARCVAWLVHRWNGQRQREIVIEAAGGLVRAVVHHNRVQMRMPDPRNLKVDFALQLDHRQLQVGSINTGVPHIVVPVVTLDQVDVQRLGRQLRSHAAFQPRGTNVNFVESNAQRPDRLRVRTYERGVEGETLACGTGVTAAAVVHALRAGRGGGERRRRIEVETRSGEILVVSMTVASPSTRRIASPVTDVVLEGSVRVICQGVVPWPIGTRRATGTKQRMSTPGRTRSR